MHVVRLNPALAGVVAAFCLATRGDGGIAIATIVVASAMVLIFADGISAAIRRRSHAVPARTAGLR